MNVRQPAATTTSVQGFVVSVVVAMMLISLTTTTSRAAAFSLARSSTATRRTAPKLLSWNVSRRPQRYLSTTTSGRLFLSAVDQETNETSQQKKTIDSTWNLGGLKKEVSRLTVRAHKKVGKAKQRLDKATAVVEELTSDPDATLEQLENCPNVDELEQDWKQLQERLQGLNQLEVLLSEEVKGKNNVVLPEHIAKLALELEVNDEPPARQPRGPKKQKGPTKMTAFRLPYRRFYSENKTEIRVGKQAQDNDELSLSPEHRDGADWWMHASGCPGSHVVIRCHDENLNEDVVMDAAALAARQSKCTGGVIKVSLTRARDVKKPPGAKAGLVQLTGRVRTVSVDMKKAQARLDRLDKTVLVN